MLAMISLTMFPMAFPQLTRLIMGRFVHDSLFQAERVAFLQKFAGGFQDGEAISPAAKLKSRPKK